MSIQCVTPRLFATILVVLGVLFVFVLPAYALPANPDSIEIHTAKLFQNIWTSGDVLLVASYEVNYATEPTEKDTFLLALYSTDGSVPIKSRALEYLQYNVFSLYFTPAEAANLTWGGEYKVRIVGNPVYFTPQEGTTMATRTLSSYDWIEGTMASSQNYLKEHCLDLAADLEMEWSVVLITTTPEKQVLNSVGKEVFLTAIPGLDTAVPDLFQVTSGTFNPTWQNRTAALQNETTVAAMLGTPIANALSGVGNWLGLGESGGALIWALLLILTIASIIFLNSGNTTAALVLAVPAFLLACYLGTIAIALLFTIAILLVVYTMYHIWLQGM